MTSTNQQSQEKNPSKYRHIKTDMLVVHDIKCHGTKVYTNMIDIGLYNCRIPAWVVEGSDEWEKIN